MDQSPPDDQNEEREKKKVISPEHFLDELDGDPSEDPDALLSRYRPNVDKELEQLASDFEGLTADIEVLDLDGDSSQDTNLTFRERCLKFKKKAQTVLIEVLSKIFYRIKYLVIGFIFESPKKVKRGIQRLTSLSRSFLAIFQKWSLRRKILFGCAIFSFGLTFYLYSALIQKNLLGQETFYFYGSMAEVASARIEFSPKTPMEPFYQSPRVKAYLFQMKPLVVNLKRLQERGNPMGFFEFVLGGSSGDVVVELKARESEILDLVTRVIEEHTYSSLESVRGKEKLKEDIRKQLNRQLSEGFIRTVDFAQIFIKP